MVNCLLREYHVWEYHEGSKLRYAVVDTYYQEILSLHDDQTEAFATTFALRAKQRGTYPSILEAS